jgi:hypothetical protein
MRIAALFDKLLAGPARLWKRIYRFLEHRAERHIETWLATLQYKRRYTNPDLIKRYRQRPSAER